MMRRRCLDTITELAREDDRVVFIGSDLGVGAMADFKAEFPDRFFMEGVAEQNLVGLAAGMAMEGRIVYLNTIATFLTRRCYEQIAVDLCMHNANVRLIANGGGVGLRAARPDAPGHGRRRDPSGAAEHDDPGPGRRRGDGPAVPRDASTTRGPIYVRVAKGHDPIVTTETGEFRIGEAVPMRDGHDALIVYHRRRPAGLPRRRDQLHGRRELTPRCCTSRRSSRSTPKRWQSPLERVPVIVSVEEHYRHRRARKRGRGVPRRERPARTAGGSGGSGSRTCSQRATATRPG